MTLEYWSSDCGDCRYRLLGSGATWPCRATRLDARTAPTCTAAAICTGTALAAATLDPLTQPVARARLHHAHPRTSTRTRTRRRAHAGLGLAWLGLAWRSSAAERQQARQSAVVCVHTRACCMLQARDLAATSSAVFSELAHEASAPSATHGSAARVAQTAPAQSPSVASGLSHRFAPCPVCIRTGLTPCGVCTRTELAPCGVCTGTGLAPCHVCTRTGLTPCHV